MPAGDELLKHLRLRQQPVDLAPPAVTLRTDLPFGQLSWEAFERLCFRLADRESNVQEARPYGVQGDPQDGIDVLGALRDSGKYRAYQCKRVQSFGPKDIREAVDEFLGGAWAAKTQSFVLCTTAQLAHRKSANEVEKQRHRLGASGIEFFVWDPPRLAALLRQNPEIIDEFFGPHWRDIAVGARTSSRLQGVKWAAPLGMLLIVAVTFAAYRVGFRGPVSISPGERRLTPGVDSENFELSVHNNSDDEQTNVVVRFEVLSRLEDATAFRVVPLTIRDTVTVGGYALETSSITARFSDRDQTAIFLRVGTLAAHEDRRFRVLTKPRAFPPARGVIRSRVVPIEDFEAAFREFSVPSCVDCLKPDLVRTLSGKSADSAAARGRLDGMFFTEVELQPSRVAEIARLVGGGTKSRRLDGGVTELPVLARAAESLIRSLETGKTESATIAFVVEDFGFQGVEGEVVDLFPFVEGPNSHFRLFFDPTGNLVCALKSGVLGARSVHAKNVLAHLRDSPATRHLFVVAWSPARLTVYVDGVPVVDGDWDEKTGVVE